MNNIDILRHIVVDKGKVAEQMQSLSTAEIIDLFGVKVSQASNLKRGEKSPSNSGLLRLMMLRNLRPEDISKVGTTTK